MAKILADRQIRKLLGSVVIDADDSLVNPNGIELRLGRNVIFQSTGEEAELGPGLFLKVNPGESVSISSLEKIDFTAKTVQEHFPDSMLMGFINPTTTMMREGISQVATKIDAGFRGILNWGLRNNSTKELVLQYGEPMFKLTMFLLEQDESPETAYGDRERDSYQDTEGIMRSRRRIPADIPKKEVVSSSFDKLDPKKQLREAGYPFDHIGTELTSLHGKFEVVSKDVMVLRDEIEKRTEALSGKIEQEAGTLLGKVEILFDRKFFRIIGIIIGAVPLMYGGVTYLQGTALGGNAIAFLAVGLGIVILAVTYVMSRKAD